MALSFQRYIGVDYSGAETANSSCKGIRVYVAEGSSEPRQVLPPPSPRKYWTRCGFAEWLRKELTHEIPTIVGIDHAFSFPLAYFEKYRLSSGWQGFLEDFQHHWPTDAPNTYVCFLRDRPTASELKRTGERDWLRMTEKWTPTAKSIFGFGVQGEVATSTHAGLPWLLSYLRKNCKRPIHFWPFDGWEIPDGNSVVAEVYPSTRHTENMRCRQINLRLVWPRFELSARSIRTATRGKSCWIWSHGVTTPDAGLPLQRLLDISTSPSNLRAQVAPIRELCLALRATCSARMRVSAWRLAVSQSAESWPDMATI